MTAGPVNRTELEANYQNPGEIYDDTKTEGAFNVIANQIDDNWNDYAAVKTALNSTTLGSSGTQYVKSPTITGVTGNDAYAQLISLKQQIDAIIGSNIPPGTINYSMLAPTPTVTADPGVIPVRDANGRFQVANPSVGADVANKTYIDASVNSVNTYYTVSDDVIVSIPTARSGASGSFLKAFYTKNAGKYRIKGEYRTLSAPTMAGIALRLGIGNDTATTTADSGVTQTTSGTFVTFSIDTPFLPENCRINLVSFGSASVQIQNVTLCGTTIIGNQNTFSGVD